MESSELTQLKTELERINRIQPEDNLRYLINQISIDNIEVSEKERVLNILNEVRLGIVSLTDKLNKARNNSKNQ